jgi:hypothetical protein
MLSRLALMVQAAVLDGQFLILSLLSTMTKDVPAARVKMASSCMLIFRQASLPVDRI